MKTEKKEDLMNEMIDPQAEELADLPVTDEQAQQAKGGSLSLNFTAIQFNNTPYDDRR
jgi:hypothetical protein